MPLFNVDPNGIRTASESTHMALEPDEANRLGWRHYLNGDFPKAEECFIAVVKADPNHAFGWGNLGLVWQQTGYWDDALKCYMESFRLDPKGTANITNMGYLHDMMGNEDHAIRCAERALELQPGSARAMGNLGTALLRRFDFARGWPLLEARFHTVPKASVMRDYPAPLWDGKPTEHLFIWPEQGVGDQIVYATLLPELIARNQPFTFEVDERLIPAFKRSFPMHANCFVAKDGPKHVFSAHIPLLSLGPIFRNSIEDFDGQPTRLLFADEARTRELGAAMQPTGRRIAISWRSFHPPINQAKERQKSARLADFQVIANACPDHQLVSVQYGDVAEELALWDGAPIHVPAIDIFNDIDGVLAAIAACDVVVTTSNVAAHYAGALGMETYLMHQGTCPFPYWSPHDGCSLWYPSVKIVGARTWAECFASVAKEMAARM